MTSFRAFAFVLFSVILMLSGCSTEQAIEVPCMSGEKGPGSVEQQNCLGEHIPGFGGYNYATGGCTMVVHLTDLKQERAARAILVPFSKAMRPECGNRMSLDIRKGQYEFAELFHWSTKARHLLMRNKDTRIPGVRVRGMGIPFHENRISFSVEKDDMLPRVKQVLRKHNIPVEAFRIGSRESELKAKAKALASFSTAPEIRRSRSGEHVVVPAVRWGGEKAAELIIGETSLHEVLRMLPPFPGHGPKKSSGKVETKLPEEIQQVLARKEQGYNPAYTQTIVGFDRKKKLIFVQNIIEREQAKRFADELDTITDMSEVYRDSAPLVKHLVKQGKLTPCVIVRTTAIVEDNNTAIVNDVAYFFTCKTKR